MQNENYVTININQDNLSEDKTGICKRKNSLKERCKEIGAVSMDEFEAEWMRQLKLRFKNICEDQKLQD
mgnify:CR=1 FL=1